MDHKDLKIVAVLSFPVAVVSERLIGFEVKNFIINDERTQTQTNHLNATFEHLYIDMNEIKNFLGDGLDYKPEETFPQFILRMHYITYVLAFRTGMSLTIYDIYGGCAIGSDEVLDCEIDVQQPVEYHVHASLIPGTAGQCNSLIRSGLLDRKLVPVACSNKRGYQEIDVTSVYLNIEFIQILREKRLVLLGANNLYLSHRNNRRRGHPGNCVVVAGKDLVDLLVFMQMLSPGLP
ncbi:3957_t:CDS:2 [Ambispora gerdemannii]|uniref:3957_t:CDS:1 n=1 Tax=Ambispora gerdemannii TaxID=144530 RepID=A0A9N9C9L3_9GLOM|nr:3957_t:CDS:2 [Ambispora gerdemannii]